ncbi:MAG TPA: ATP synthase subunit I [Candidatus Sulfotelmatobacter sp.]|nr:ATP synthase subunit I [Candidatus Sulfotelmatobacter sp.]
MPGNEEAFYAAAERRIEYLTIGLGCAAAVAAGFRWGVRAGGGVATGALLSWINFRWLKQGVGALAMLSSGQQGAEKVRVPKSVYVKFLGRFFLLILGAYAILRSFRLPVSSFLAGLFAVVAAALIEMIGQLFRSGPTSPSDS